MVSAASGSASHWPESSTAEKSILSPKFACHPDRIELVGDHLESFVVDDFRFAETMPIFFSLPRLAKSYLKSFREAMAPES
jgi:hypothetical protein